MKQYMEKGMPNGSYEKLETETSTVPAQWALILLSSVLAGLVLLVALLYWWQFSRMDMDAPLITPTVGIGHSVIADAAAADYAVNGLSMES